MQSFVMFFGEFMAMFLYLGLIRRNEKVMNELKVSAKAKNINMNLKKYFFAGIPAFADCITSIL